MKKPDVSGIVRLSFRGPSSTVAAAVAPISAMIGEVKESATRNATKNKVRIPAIVLFGRIWAFTTGGETLVALRKSRGKKVLKEVLGRDFDGTIVCDGWSSYATYVKSMAPKADLQRCWAHLLREVEDLAGKCEEAEPISKRIHEIYEDLTGFVGKGPSPKEQEKRREKAEKNWKDS